MSGASAIVENKILLVWLRFVRRKVYLWVSLVVTVGQICFSEGEDRIREEVRFYIRLARIDFVSVIELMNDLLW